MINICNGLFSSPNNAWVLILLQNKIHVHIAWTSRAINPLKNGHSCCSPTPWLEPAWPGLARGALTGISCFETSFWSGALSCLRRQPAARARHVSSTVGGRIRHLNTWVESVWNDFDYVSSLLRLLQLQLCHWPVWFPPSFYLYLQRFYLNKWERNRGK